MTRKKPDAGDDDFGPYTDIPPDHFLLAGNRAHFRGHLLRDVVWLIDIRAPADDPQRREWIEGALEIQQTWGMEAFMWVAVFVYSRLELRAEPEYREDLVQLLRQASRIPNLVLHEGYRKQTKLTEAGRRPLAIAADSVERYGFYQWITDSELVPVVDVDHLPIPSPGHYFALQEALAKNRFGPVDGGQFPRASLERGGVKGHAELRQITPEEELLLPPAETEALARQMWRQREELSDKDADALDAVSACWLRRARTTNDRVAIHIDEILRMRGLKPKRSGSGRRGGFEPEQRAEVFRSLLHLQDVWLDIAEVTVYEGEGKTRRKPVTRSFQSRAFVMTDRVGQRRLDGTMDVEAVLVTPGSAFGRFLYGPGRQVALLSANALRYNPLRQQPEKRLLRYLSWQWRIGAGQGAFVKVYRVPTLLEETGIDVYEPKPAKTRDRLEKCLDALQEQGDIAAWQYAEGWREEDLPRKGWVPLWLEARISVEAPQAIQDAYQNLEELNRLTEPPKPRPATKATPPWATMVKGARKRRHVSQTVAAAEIGISQPLLSQIERGRRNPSETVAQKIQQWLGEAD